MPSMSSLDPTGGWVMWVSIIPILKGSNIFKTLKRIKEQPETYWLTLVNIGIG